MGGTVDRAIKPGSIPTALEKAQLTACCTMTSGRTFQASLAVALALWAPSICKIRASARILLASAASTKERCMLIFR